MNNRWVSKVFIIIDKILREGKKMYNEHNNDIDVQVVADFFLNKTDEEAGEFISHLKLQKLLYYAQGFVLALTNQRLFSNQIRAWQHGPVVEDIYRQYKDKGSNCIKKPDNSDLSVISNNDEVLEILEEVWDVYGQFSAWKLREMTHEEKPWLDTSINQVISLDLIKNFFQTKIA